MVGKTRGINQNQTIQDKNIMIYIGFSTKSHKIIAHIFCRKFRHCAPIYVGTKKCILYQFVAPGQIYPVQLKRRDIKILTEYGWVFIKYNCKLNLKAAEYAKTCVQYTKRALGIKNANIQTPDALFRYLNHK